MIFLKSKTIEDRKRAVRQHLWTTHMCEFDELSAAQPAGAAEPAAMLDFLEFTICNYATGSPLMLEQAMLCRDAKYLKVAELARIAESIAQELLDYSVMADRRRGIALNIREYRRWLNLSFPPEIRTPFSFSQSYTAFHRAGYTAIYEDGKWTKPRKNWRSGIPSLEANEAMDLALAG
jgi:hypothetical protein